MCPTDQGIARNSHLKGKSLALQKVSARRHLHAKRVGHFRESNAPCQAFASRPWSVVNCQLHARQGGSQPKPATSVPVGWVQPTSISAYFRGLDPPCELHQSERFLSRLFRRRGRHLLIQIRQELLEVLAIAKWVDVGAVRRMLRIIPARVHGLFEQFHCPIGVFLILVCGLFAGQRIDAGEEIRLTRGRTRVLGKSLFRKKSWDDSQGYCRLPTTDSSGLGAPDRGRTAPASIPAWSVRV